MVKNNIETKTENYFKNGLCCSESIVKAILENQGFDQNENIVKAASGFCGGIGGSHEEICGALSGAILAIGFLYGRSNPNEDNDNIKFISSELLNCFKKKYHTTKCSRILETIGEQKNGEKCCELTANTSKLVLKLIDQYC